MQNKKKGLVFTLASLTAVVLLIISVHLFALNDNTFLPTLTPGERQWLQQHKDTLRICPTPDNYPIDYIDHHGKQGGVVGDYFRLLEKRLNVKFKLVPAANWMELLENAKNKKTDIVCEIQETPERRRYLLFTDPYIKLPVVIVTSIAIPGTINPEKMKGMRVAVTKGYAIETYLKTHYGFLDLHPVVSEVAGLRKVSFHEVDAMIVELPIATYFIEEEGITNLRIAGDAGYTYRLAIGSRRDWPILNRILQKGLDSISDEERKEIHNRWITLNTPPHHNHKTIFITFFAFFGLGLLVIALVFYWNQTLKKRVAIRTQELKDELIRRKAAEKEVWEKERRMSTLMGNLPGMAYRCLNDANWSMTYVSNGCLLLTGYSTLDLIDNRKVSYNNLVHPDDRGQVWQKVQNALDIKKPFEFSYRIITKSGEEKWVWEQGVGIYSESGNLEALEGFITDISRRKYAEEALTRSEEKYRKIFEQSTEGIYQSNPDGSFLTVNPAFAKMFGYKDPQEVIDTIEDVERQIYLGDESRKTFHQLIEKNGIAMGFESKAICKDGTIIDIVENAQAIRDENGKLLYYEGNVVDITTKKQAQILRIAKDEAELARKSAEAANQAKSEFLANMSHEIRTPLNAILGFAEILDHRIQDNQLKQFARSIVTGGKTLLGLINDILDLSKIEAGKMELHYSAVNITGILLEIREIFNQKIQEKGLNFDTVIDPQVPKYLMMDEIRLRQVLFNLVGNAVKFTETGGITVAVERKPEDKTNLSIDIVISVRDTGIGIPEDQQELIFQAFDQQKGQDISKYGGTGLGLNITKRLVKMMGGYITLQSKPEGGSTFQVILEDVLISDPLNESMDDEAISTDIIRSVTFEGSTVMVVDDMEFNRELIQSFLENKEVTIIEAENGREAIDLAKKFSPQLIIMDIKMPVMSGDEAVKILKKDESLRHIPVIMLTASVLKKDEHNSWSMGCEGFLKKPVSMNHFFMELMRFLPYSLGKKKLDEETIDGKESDGSESGEIVIEEQNAQSRIRSKSNPVAMSTKTELLKLLEIMDKEWAPQINGFAETFVFDEIESFSLVVLTLGRRFQIDEVMKWGELLLGEAQAYDMENLPTTLAYFTELRKIIAAMAE